MSGPCVLRSPIFSGRCGLAGTAGARVRKSSRPQRGIRPVNGLPRKTGVALQGAPLPTSPSCKPRSGSGGFCSGNTVAVPHYCLISRSARFSPPKPRVNRSLKYSGGFCLGNTVASVYRGTGPAARSLSRKPRAQHVFIRPNPASTACCQGRLAIEE